MAETRLAVASIVLQPSNIVTPNKMLGKMFEKTNKQSIHPSKYAGQTHRTWGAKTKLEGLSGQQIYVATVLQCND